MTLTAIPAPEFARPVRVESLRAGATVRSIEADAGEREALARRFDLLAIESLRAEVTLRPLSGGSLVGVDGQFLARVVQRCVVTLEPVPATVEDRFALTFGPPADDDDAAVEVVLDVDEPDPPEPILDGVIDIGEAVAEHLALALDPFPRALGASFAPPAEAADEERVSPFAALAGLKSGKKPV